MQTSALLHPFFSGRLNQLFHVSEKLVCVRYGLSDPPRFSSRAARDPIYSFEAAKVLIGPLAAVLKRPTPRVHRWWTTLQGIKRRRSAVQTQAKPLLKR
jgi:hypothetical protein